MAKKEERIRREIYVVEETWFFAFIILIRTSWKVICPKLRPSTAAAKGQFEKSNRLWDKLQWKMDHTSRHSTHALATSTVYAGRRSLPWLACNVARASNHVWRNKKVANLTMVLCVLKKAVLYCAYKDIGQKTRRFVILLSREFFSNLAY